MPCSRIVNTLAVLAPPDRQRPQVRHGRDRQGGDHCGQRVAADELQHHPARPGGADPAGCAPNPCASSSARSANAFGDCPDTSRTVTRSAHGPAWTLPSTGRVTWPR